MSYPNPASSNLDLQRLESASAAGNLHASYELACHYATTTDKIKAFILFKTAAERGHPQAQYKLAMCYKNGEGCSINYAQAVHWLTQAENANILGAALELGHCYNAGLGVPQDYKTAMKYYKKAEKLGHSFTRSEEVQHTRMCCPTVVWNRFCAQFCCADVSPNHQACTLPCSGDMGDGSQAFFYGLCMLVLPPIFLCCLCHQCHVFERNCGGSYSTGGICPLLGGSGEDYAHYADCSCESFRSYSATEQRREYPLALPAITVQPQPIAAKKQKGMQSPPPSYISQQPKAMSPASVGASFDFAPASMVQMTSRTQHAAWEEPDIVASAHSAPPSFSSLQNIPRREIVFNTGNKIGEGGFGIVYRADWKGTEVAVKELRDASLSKNTKRDFFAEANVMSGLRHPHIVVLFGAVMDQEPYCMILELMEESLHQLLHDDQRDISDAEKIRFGYEIASGLDYMHSQKIIHRDLKPGNVLLDKDRKAKLSDFGFARLKAEVNSKFYEGSKKGTSEYMAPELLTSLTVQYSPYSDAYAYAMTLWEIASRQIPYSGVNGQLVIALVTQGKRAEIPTSTPQVLHEVIQNCWAAEPKSRPALSSILQMLAKHLPQKGAPRNAPASFDFADHSSAFDDTDA